MFTHIQLLKFAKNMVLQIPNKLIILEEANINVMKTETFKNKMIEYI
jgi:hypothetical protein